MKPFLNRIGTVGLDVLRIYPPIRRRFRAGIPFYQPLRHRIGHPDPGDHRIRRNISQIGDFQRLIIKRFHSNSVRIPFAGKVFRRAYNVSRLHERIVRCRRRIRCPLDCIFKIFRRYITRLPVTVFDVFYFPTLSIVMNPWDVRPNLVGVGHRPVRSYFPLRHFRR